MKKVLVGGRFNLIHPGHIYFLEKARALGDYLVVVVASDQTIRNSGKEMIFPEEERKRMLEALRAVNKAVIGYDISGVQGYLKIIREVKPDIIAVGYDQDFAGLKKLLEKERIPARIVKIKNYKSLSTSSIVKNESVWD